MEPNQRADRLQFLLHDRDAKFTAASDKVLTAASTDVIKTPPQAPPANAFTERWAAPPGGSAQTGCWSPVNRTWRPSSRTRRTTTQNGWEASEHGRIPASGWRHTTTADPWNKTIAVEAWDRSI